MKTYKNIKIKRVTAYPLNADGTNLNSDYSIGITNGFKMPLEIKEEFIIPNIKNAGKAIIATGGLSYKYKAGDITCFMVKYTLDSKTGVQSLIFVTTKDEK